jgi:hypothetical protein
MDLQQAAHLAREAESLAIALGNIAEEDKRYISTAAEIREMAEIAWLNLGRKSGLIHPLQVSLSNDQQRALKRLAAELALTQTRLVMEQGITKEGAPF